MLSIFRSEDGSGVFKINWNFLFRYWNVLKNFGSSRIWILSMMRNDVQLVVTNVIG